MKINLIRLASSIDPNKPYLKDSEEFIAEINNELFEYDLEVASNINDGLFSIIFIETGGSEQLFKNIFQSLPEPIILLTDSKNNSLAATLEIRTFLEQRNKRHLLLFGEEKNIARTIYEMSKYYICKRNMDEANLGVIGHPSDWLIASKVDYKTAKEKFNVNLIDISTDELKQEIEKGYVDHIPHLSVLKQKAASSEVLDGALKIYSGLKRIIKKYDLKGFTLRCFDLISEYKNTACLAFALLNEEGITATCEGDVPTLITMFVIKSALNLSSFQANPSRIDVKDMSVLFADCTVPINMSEDYELMTHFESGLGIGVRGKLHKGKVTIIKINPELDHTLFISGEIEENTTYENCCRTQIKVKIDEDGLFDLIKTPFGNHVVIVYGDVIDSIIPILDLYQCLNNQ